MIAYKVNGEKIAYVRENVAEVREGELSMEAYPPVPDDEYVYGCGVKDGVFAWVPIGKKPQEGPTKAEQESRRASAYRERVDPLTAEITRKESDLARGIVPEEDEQKVRERIAEAYAERDSAVKAIDEEFPYPASAGDADTTAQEQPLPTLY